VFAAVAHALASSSVITIISAVRDERGVMSHLYGLGYLHVVRIERRSHILSPTRASQHPALKLAAQVFPLRSAAQWYWTWQVQMRWWWRASFRQSDVQDRRVWVLWDPDKFSTIPTHLPKPNATIAGSTIEGSILSLPSFMKRSGLNWSGLGNASSSCSIALAPILMDTYNIA
jgi:hypothetical protein